MVEPTPLKLLIMVIFASLVVGTFIAAYSEFLGSTGKSEFLQGAEEIAEIAGSLKPKGSSSSREYTIEVPSGAQLEFENEYVIAVTNNSQRFDANVNIYGPILVEGRHNLLIKRVENGVEITVG